MAYLYMIHEFPEGILSGSRLHELLLVLMIHKRRRYYGWQVRQRIYTDRRIRRDWAYFFPYRSVFNYETFVFSDLFMFHPPGLRKRSKSKRFQTFFFLHIKYDQTCPKLIWVILFLSAVKTVIIVERFPHYCSTFKDYIDGHFQFMKQNNYKKTQLDATWPIYIDADYFFKRLPHLYIINFTHIP